MCDAKMYSLFRSKLKNFSFESIWVIAQNLNSFKSVLFFFQDLSLLDLLCSFLLRYLGKEKSSSSDVQNSNNRRERKYSSALDLSSSNKICGKSVDYLQEKEYWKYEEFSQSRIDKLSNKPKSNLPSPDVDLTTRQEQLELCVLILETLDQLFGTTSPIALKVRF